LVVRIPSRSSHRKIVAAITLLFQSFPTFASAMHFSFMFFPLGAIFFWPWGPFGLFSATEWLVESYPLHYGRLWAVLGAIGIALIAVGMAMFLAAYLQYLSRRKAGLVKTGLYSVVRHPQYLGIILATFGLFLFRRPTSAWPLPLPGTFVHWMPMEIIAWLTLVFIYVLLANSEEKYLQRKHGRDFLSYKREVSFILPILPPNVSERLPIKVPTSGFGRVIFLLSIYLSMVIITAIILKSLL